VASIVSRRGELAGLVYLLNTPMVSMQVHGPIRGHHKCTVASMVSRRAGRTFSDLACGREDVDSASGPACVVLRWCGRRVGGLGPGLTCESADALSGCPSNDSSAGSQVLCGTRRRCRPDLPVLCKRAGFTRSGCQRVRAIPQPRKGRL
jgi:hypothetical protein